MEYGTYYTVSTILAFVGAVLAGSFVAFSIWAYVRSINPEFWPSCKERYGALYQDLKEESRIALFTGMFQNVQIVILITLMVILVSSPMAQSAAYLACSTLSLAWDLIARPYESRLMAGQMLILDVARVAAGAGFIVLSLPGISLDTSILMCWYEILVLLCAMVLGLVLALIQQILGAVLQLKECLTLKGEEYRIPKVSSSNSLRAAASFGFFIRTLGTSSVSPANIRVGDSAGGLEDSSATGSQKFDRSIVS